MTVPAEIQRKIDRECDAFEAAWLAGECPRIEDFLSGVADDAQKALLEELLLLDMDFGRSAGEHPNRAAYTGRFPEHRSLIDRLLAEFSETPVEKADQPQLRVIRSPAGNILYALLALQNGLVRRDDLIEHVQEWIRDKHRSLVEILVDKKALSADERQLMDALFAKYVIRHGGDLEASLASLSTLGSLREELEALGDDELSQSIAPAGTRSWTKIAAQDGAHDTEGVRLTTRTRLRILRPHAKGGLGEVSVALDEDLHREVAFKEMQERLAGHDDSRGRFVREAEVTGRLEHPGIVPVYGLGQYADGRPFYAMRFIKGPNLKTAIEEFHASDQGRRSPEERSRALRELLARFLDVCDAISYAHSRGVLHRDLKPGNVMLGEYGETLVVDWGLAKSVGRGEHASPDVETLTPHDSGSSQTELGRAVGTPQYMSPEQAEGRIEDLGPATDIYALGATLYCLLTGQPPIKKNSAQVMVADVQEGNWAKPCQIKNNVPRPLEAICVRAMALRPDQRYGSVQQLADEIRNWLADAPVGAHQESFFERVSRVERRHRALVRSVGAALVVISVLSIAFAIGFNRERQMAEAAASESDAAKARTERVLDYLVMAFSSPDPSIDGREVTVAEILDAAVGKLDADLADDPLAQAPLLDAIGATYRGLGLFEKAIKASEKAVELAEENLGQHDPETLNYMSNLASSYSEAGKLHEAEAVAEETLELRRTTLGEHHEDTLRSLNDVALTYLYRGRIKDATHLLKQLFDIRSTQLGPDHRQTLRAMNNLAGAYFEDGQNEPALRLWKQSFELRRSTLGSDHPKTLASMDNLANAYSVDNQLDKALSLYRRSLELHVATLGQAHPHTLIPMCGLGSVYRDAGQVDKALPLLEKAVELGRATLPEDHPHVLRRVHSLAMGYKAAEQLDKALPLLERRLKLTRAKLGPNHPDTLISTEAIASVYQAMDQLDEALPLYEKALELSVAKWGEGHPKTLKTSRNAAVAYLKAGRRGEALAMLKESLRRERDRLPKNDTRLASVLLHAGQGLVEGNEWAAAEPYLRECTALYESLKTDDWRLYQARIMLGAAFAGQQRFDEAEPLLIQGYEGMKQHEQGMPRPLPKDLKAAAQHLVDFYTDTEQPDEVANWAVELDRVNAQVEALRDLKPSRSSPETPTHDVEATHNNDGVQLRSSERDDC